MASCSTISCKFCSSLPPSAFISPAAWRRGRPRGESLTHCAECEEPIPEARRQAIPGVRLCIECQTERDRAPVARGGINRRGSKDSQLK